MRPFRVAVLLCLAASACSDGPTAPDPVSRPSRPTLLAPGRYLLSVVNREDSPCTGRLDSWDMLAPSIGGFVTVSAEGDGWIARAESAGEGDIELRLRRTASNQGEPLLSGAIRGTLRHSFDRFSTSPRMVSFAGADGADAAGVKTTLVASPTVAAIAAGAVTFTHSSGTTVGCREVFLILGPVPQ